MSVAPSCPDTHVFDKNNCLCLVKPTSKEKTLKANKSTEIGNKMTRKSTKTKECKSGKQKNANGRCVKIKNVTKKKECPTGKFLNKKTNRCNKLPPCKSGKNKNNADMCLKENFVTANVNPNSKREILSKNTNKVNVTVIQVPGTAEEKMISKQISELVSTNQSHEIISKQIQTQRSFSPSINKRVVSIHKSPRADIFQCGDGIKEYLGTNKFSNAPYPEISVGNDKNGNPICKKMNTNKARDVLLHNIRNIIVDENQIIAPIQKRSNCWFNAFFVTFFISDKGRKFFRYFREMMVTGKHSNGKKFDPKLAKSFLMLNACIEASYGNQDIALSMDTNNVIWNIYRAIPLTKRRGLANSDWIRDVNRTGNPLGYYDAIMRFIDNNDLKYRKIMKFEYNQAMQSKLTQDILPDLLIVRIEDSQCANMTYSETIFVTEDSTNKKGKYALDAVIVRDTQKRHFCTLLTVNDKQYGFDGASHSRLAPFGWKPYLLTQKGIKSEWTFTGSIFDRNPDNSIKWSFSSAYHLIFYYRVA